MISLPNPFTQSALAPAMAADTAAAPDLTDPPVAADGHFAEPATEAGGPQEAPAAVAANPHETAGALGSENYIPELFSSFVARRSLPIVNPPMPQECRRGFELDEAAFFDAIMPPEPPPVFLRRPSQEFLRALFELSH